MGREVVIGSDFVRILGRFCWEGFIVSGGVGRVGI